MTCHFSASCCVFRFNPTTYKSRFSVENTKMKTAEALEVSKKDLIYLEKKSLKDQDPINRAVLLNALSATKSTVTKLEHLQVRLENLGTQAAAFQIKTIVEEAIPLILQTDLQKSRMHSFELMSHLEAKSLETKNSQEHYKMLMQNVAAVNNRLTNINPAFALDFLDRELGTIENKIVPLTKQTPYTLLMMRVVEIGLPLLLSILSIFLVLYYSLTEKRCHEIQELLKQRSKEKCQ